MSSDPIKEGVPEGLGSRVKRFLPRTLEGRTLAIILIPVVVAQLITTYLFFERHFSTLSVELARAMAGDIAMVISRMEHAPDMRDAIFADARRAMDIAVTFEPDAKLGPLRGPHWNPLIEPVLTTALEERVGGDFTIGAHDIDNSVEIRVQLDEGVLQVVTPQRRLFSYTAFVFILWVIGVSILLTWVAVVFMRNQVRPIRRLAMAAESFGRGQDNVRLRPAGALEVRQAAAAFMVMRDRIRRQIAQRTEMLAGVSHDLRTPLTRMKLNLALMEGRDDIRDLQADLAEMENMIEAYLAFARGEGAEPPQQTDIVRLLTETIEGLPAGNDVLLKAAGPVEIMVRPATMKRCLANLLGNAVRYGTRVEVSLFRRGGGISIAIDDNGPGIPADRREDMFRAFVRLDLSRNTATGGVGLGLAVSREIVHGHGGNIELEDSPLGGLRVVVTLPA